MSMIRKIIIGGAISVRPDLIEQIESRLEKIYDVFLLQKFILK
ncbi:MAG: hypothetical protein ACLRQF_05870 [Thomasclavelia ramosa]